MWSIRTSCRQPPDALPSRSFIPCSCTRRAHRASTPLAAGHYSTRIWASPLARVLANAPGRIAFVSCGPSVPLPLLSTPPCGDAVTVRYKSKRFDLSRTYTSLHNHTHWRTNAEPQLGVFPFGLPSIGPPAVECGEDHRRGFGRWKRRPPPRHHSPYASVSDVPNASRFG